MKEERTSEIFPFGQTERVGNFKLWRGRWKVKTSDGTTEIDCVHASDLSGAWSVRIPSTYEMYGIVVGSFCDYVGGSDDEKARGEAVLRTILSNMMFASVVGNGYFQRGIEMLAMVYANPSLLSVDDDVHRDFMKDVDATVGAFLEWRRGYEEEIRKHEPTEDDDHHEDIAEQAADILSEE